MYMLQQFNDLRATGPYDAVTQSSGCDCLKVPAPLKFGYGGRGSVYTYCLATIPAHTDGVIVAVFKEFSWHHVLESKLNTETKARVKLFIFISSSPSLLPNTIGPTNHLDVRGHYELSCCRDHDPPRDLPYGAADTPMRCPGSSVSFPQRPSASRLLGNCSRDRPSS